MKNIVMLWLIAFISLTWGEVPPLKKEGGKHLELVGENGGVSFFSERGLRLYGGYFFDARGGELSTLYKGDKQIIPEGVVLVAVKKHYILGLYEGKIIVESKNAKVKLGKIFFSISKKGVIEYYRPHKKNRNFAGAKISNEDTHVLFP